MSYNWHHSGAAYPAMGAWNSDGLDMLKLQSQTYTEQYGHRAALKSEELLLNNKSFSSADGTSASQAAAKMWGKRLILPLASQ